MKSLSSNVRARLGVHEIALPSPCMHLCAVARTLRLSIRFRIYARNLNQLSFGICAEPDSFAHREARLRTGERRRSDNADGSL